jgi:hypothetical protein
VLVQQGKKVLIEILSLIAMNPGTICDFVLILREFPGLFQSDAISVKICQILVYYLMLSKSFHVPEWKNDFEIARVCALLWLREKSEFSNKEESDDFVNFFLSFVFEEPLRDFVFEYAEKFTSEKVLSEKLTDLICSAIPQNPTADLVRLVRDLLAYFNKKRLLFSKKELSQLLIFWIAKLSQSDLSRSTLHFLMISITLNQYQLSSTTESLLEFAIREQYPEPDDSLFFDFVTLISGKPHDSISRSFVIVSNCGAHLFLKIFLNSDFCFPILDFFQTLCNFSSQNCRKMAKSGIDLDLLNHFTITTDPEISNLILSILFMIASIFTSHLFIRKLFLLISPLQVSQLPRHFFSLLDFVRRLLISAIRIPIIAVPIFRDSVISITGLTGQIAHSNFCFSIWLFVEDSQNPRQILTFVDSQQSLFSVRLAGFDLLLSAKSENSWGGSVPQAISNNIWSLLVLKFMFNSNKRQKLSVLISVNGVDLHTLHFPAECFRDGPISVEIGDSSI